MLKSSGKSANKRVEALKRRLASLDHMCSGNLRRRYTGCGTRNWRYKASSREPHGPYHYWSRLLKGRVVQRVLSKEKAEIVARGIENYREAKELLRRWEEETVETIEVRRKPKR